MGLGIVCGLSWFVTCVCVCVEHVWVGFVAAELPSPSHSLIFFISLPYTHIT
jgi:hypothetical protein